MLASSLFTGYFLWAVDFGKTTFSLQSFPIPEIKSASPRHDFARLLILPMPIPSQAPAVRMIFRSAENIMNHLIG